MQAWEAAMAPHGVPTAQLLLTIDDSERRRRWLNARATLGVLLAHGALPVINENDSIATEELRYGDNDRLAARAAGMMGSDVLILLSDVDGLYTADPAADRHARHIPVVRGITDEIVRVAGGASAGGVGTGGMATKVAAAGIAARFGCATIVADGRGANPVARLLGGARSTLFPADASPASAYKSWIAGTLRPAGDLSADAGAVRALRSGGSLLPAGVVAVGGAFDRGACVSVREPGGGEVARGLSAYGSTEAAAILGIGSDRIAECLGYRGPDELIHRDDLALL